MESSIPDILDITLEVSPVQPDSKLSATGMIVVNPPYVLQEQLQLILPALARILGDAGKGRYSIVRLAEERGSAS